MPKSTSDHVAIFNPLVLPLPNWHPAGPDGDVDGYVVPFVMPPPSPELAPNRHSKIVVRNADGAHDDDGLGWRAEVSNVQAAGSMAKTAEQARALAAAWIRAAEVLENVIPKPEPDDVVDAEVIDDDEDQGAEPNDETPTAKADRAKRMMSEKRA